MSAIVIAGFSSTDKVPGAYGEVLYGTGVGSVLGIPKALIAVGYKTSDGSATPHVDRLPIRSDDDARLGFGYGAHLTRTLMAARFQRTDINLYGMAITEPTGDKATLTLTIDDDGSPWTAGGTLSLRLNGKTYRANFASTDDATDIGDAIAAAINTDKDCPFSAANTAGVVVITVKNKGAHGNEYIGYLDKSLLPAHATATLTGGASLTAGGVRFTGGTGVPDYSAALAALFPVRNHYIILPATDAASLQAWRTQINAQAAPIEAKLQHAVCGSADTFVTATGLTQTTLNDARFSLLWHPKSEVHISELVANYGAERAARGQSNPNSNFDGVVLKSARPQADPADWLQHATLDAALNAGVTPCVSTSDGRVAIARAITTRCMVGGVPNYDTLDVGDAEVPDYLLEHLKIRWDTEFVVANPIVRDDPDPDLEPEVKSGVATPSVWNHYVFAEMLKLEAGAGFPHPILSNVRKYPPQSTWDEEGERIMTAAPCKAAPHQHQVGISVRQRGG